MKLKDFFFSTLPRSRKSKQKQSKNAAQNSSASSSNTKSNDQVLRNSKLHTDVINGNNDFINGNSKKKKRTPTVATGHATNAHAQPGYVSSNHYLVSSNFQYYTDSNRNSYANPYGHQTLTKIPSNASESGFEDGHDHYYDSYSLQSTFQQTADPTYQPDLLTNSYNTFPRERTRIKTNPWVKNTNTMTSSINGQATTDSDVEYKSPYSVTPSSSYGSARFTDYHNSGQNGNYSDYHPGSSSGSSIAPDYSVPSSPMAGHVTYRNTNTQTFDDTNDGVYDDAHDSKQDGVVEGGDLVINLNTGDIFVKPKPDFSPVSFQYEEDLDATLERDNGRRKTKSRRKRDEEKKCFYLTQEDVSAKMEELRGESDDCEEFIMDLGGHAVDSDSDNDVDREGTLTRDGTTPQWSYQTSNNHSFRKRGLKQRKYRMDAVLHGEVDASPGVYSPYKAMHYEGGEYHPQKCCDNNVAMLDMSQHREGTDSAYDSSTLSSVTGSSLHGQLPAPERQHPVERHQTHRPTTLPGVKHRKHKAHASEPTNRRSLEEIQCGLREKVGRLKAEKRIVDEKIQQAREEEEIRREEMVRIEQEVSSLRKQVLLQTLQDLKDNLSDQSRRLQEAYDDVLDMQWLNAKLRRLRNTTL